jgi:hypothetical protein
MVEREHVKLEEDAEVADIIKYKYLSFINNYIFYFIIL